MITIKNLSAHASVRLLSQSPYVMGINSKTGREIRMADLTNEELREPTVAAYLTAYAVETYAPNTGINPKVVELEATTIVEDHDGIIITRSVGGKTVVEGLPGPEEGVVYLTSIVVAKAAARADVVSPDVVCDPATGFAIGAIGYLAFG